VQTAAAPWSERFTTLSLSWKSPTDILDGRDITFVIAGRNTRDNYNDVWASSDDGKTWVAINPAAPFMQRSSAGGVVSKDGLLIVAGGFADDDAGVFNRQIANDVWVSMNGGYSWGRCVLDAEWDDRFQQAVVLDDAGYLYIVSGGVGVDVQSVLQDVWRSTTTFSDLASVARLCGTTVPECGVGLKCWPGPGTVLASDGSFVSCDACPVSGLNGGGSSSSSSNNGLVIALVVFVLLFVAAAVAAGFYYRKAKQMGGGGPAAFSSDHFGAVDSSGLMQHTSL